MSLIRPKITKYILAAFIYLLHMPAFAQTPEMDRLRKLVQEHPQQDTIRVNRLNAFGLEARKSTAADSYNSYTESLALSRRLGYIHGEGVALLGFGFYYRFSGNLRQGIASTLDALRLFENIKDTLSIITCDYNLSSSYNAVGNFDQSIAYAINGLKLAELLNNSKWMILVNYQLGNLYVGMKDFEKANNYMQKSFTLARAANDIDGTEHAMEGIGWLYENRNSLDTALDYYKKSRELHVATKDLRGELQVSTDIANVYEQQGKYAPAFSIVYRVIPELIQLGQNGYLPVTHDILARAHLHTGNYDSALYYGFKTLNASQRSGRVAHSRAISKVIAEAYAHKGNYAEAYRYQLMFSKYIDSVNINDGIKRSSAMQYSFELDKKQSQISLLTRNEELREKESKQQQVLLIVTLAGLLVLVGFSIVLWRNNRLKQKAYTSLEHQQAELKATQSQLIQSEKMASLGELTAGIAHEIQNPLNFVNNFSEINKELLAEMNSEIEKENYAEVKVISKDITENEEKIIHHGKRADAIVKGMLQHSHSSNGIKEPTDINALADEYLRLAYHGLRAKDKSFNATMQTDFDESIGKINVLTQDLGRVILNLITNAFYAVTEKKRKAVDNYEPTVLISTKKIGDSVMIKVRDNGMGIPANVREKIFQPFFTTKPTGEGTGLGLSMSYDIITKGHGGEISVTTREGQYTEFSIVLPV